MRQQAAEHEPAPHALVVLDRVHLDRAPALLGEVHGDVGPLQEQRHVVAVLRRASAMPALAVTASVSPSISIGRDISALSSFTMAIARSGFGDVGDDQGELVAAQTRHGGPSGHGAQQALGDLAQAAGRRWRDPACR